LEDILRRANELPHDDRRKLIDSLEERLADEQAGSPETAQAAAFERWVSLAGTCHSDFTDVSGDKYKHLAAV